MTSTDRRKILLAANEHVRYYKWTSECFGGNLWRLKAVKSRNQSTGVIFMEKHRKNDNEIVQKSLYNLLSVLVH